MGGRRLVRSDAFLLRDYNFMYSCIERHNDTIVIEYNVRARIAKRILVFFKKKRRSIWLFADGGVRGKTFRVRGDFRKNLKRKIFIDTIGFSLFRYRYYLHN